MDFLKYLGNSNLGNYIFRKIPETVFEQLFRKPKPFPLSKNS